LSFRHNIYGKSRSSDFRECAGAYYPF
jgi:hypothetical protein